MTNYVRLIYVEKNTLWFFFFALRRHVVHHHLHFSKKLVMSLNNPTWLMTWHHVSCHVCATSSLRTCQMSHGATLVSMCMPCHPIIHIRCHIWLLNGVIEFVTKMLTTRYHNSPKYKIKKKHRPSKLKAQNHRVLYCTFSYYLFACYLLNAL